MRINAAPAQVLSVATLVLRTEFPELRIDSDERSIESNPVQYTTTRDSGTTRDIVGGETRMRRRAAFVVDPVGGGSVARLRVAVERKDTERRTIASQPRAGFGHPEGASAIENDTELTADQREVWTSVGRDSALERALLDEISAPFEPADALEPASAAP